MKSYQLMVLLVAGLAAFSADLPANPAPTAKIPISFPQSLLQNAQELIRVKNYNAALGILSSYKPAPEERAAYHAAWAEALQGAGRDSEAIEHLRLAYLFAPSDEEKARLLLERGAVYARLNFFSEAALCYDLLLKQYSRTSFRERASLGLADARFRLGQYSEALRHYEQAGASSRALYGKANTLQALGMLKDAHALYLALLARDRAPVDTSEETRYYIAENFRQSGRLPDAKIYYSSLQSPAFKPKAGLGLGLIALLEGKPDKAQEHLAEPARSADRGVRCQALFLTAEASLRLGKKEEAVGQFREIRNACPYGKEQDAANLMLARIAKNEGKYDEATALLKGLVFRRAPDAAALDEVEALVLEAAKRDRQEFLKLWGAVGQWLLEPSRSATLVSVARTLRGTGKPLQELCRWLIKNGSEDAKSEARLLLAEFYAELGDGNTAQRYLQRVDRRKQSDEYGRIQARVLAAAKEYDKAADALLSLKTTQESDVLMLIDIAGSTKTAVRPKILQFSERSFKQLPASVRATLRYADLLYEVGRFAEARKYYEKALKGTAQQDGGGILTQQDQDWARYRLLVLTDGATLPGPKTAAPPVSQQTSGMEGRLLDADRKGKEISQRVKKVM